MVFIESHNVITSLGWSTEENVDQILKGITGLKICEDKSLSKIPFPVSKITNDIYNNEITQVVNSEDYTRLELLAILSIKKTLETSKINITDKRTLIVLSTTKGNIELLDEELKGDFSPERVNLWSSAQKIAKYFNNSQNPQIVSNACVSGVVGIVLGKRLIDSGAYDHVVVVGADVLSKFVVSGFQSFMSLSPNPCKPFDKNRDGLSLGEGIGSVVLTNKEEIITGDKIEVVSGATSNDANHISGPSRTGEGLFLSIKNTLQENDQVDFISAHGTATPYNDDMESKAIFRAGLKDVPVNSLKGYFGHTLGAAGLIETLVNIEGLKRNITIPTIGYKDFGVAEEINICTDVNEKPMQTLLKLASGFGGCNAAAFFRKHG